MIDKVAALLLVFFTIFIIISYVKQSDVFGKKERLGDQEAKDEISEDEGDDL
jgi:flagellar biosynthesis protein FlhB